MTNTFDRLFGKTPDPIIVIDAESWDVHFQNAPHIALIGKKIMVIPEEMHEGMTRIKEGSRSFVRMTIDTESRGKLRVEVRYGGRFTSETGREVLYVRCHEVVDGNHWSDEFIRSTRDPVNAIVGVTDLLQQTDLNELQREYLSVIATSVQDLKRTLRSEDLKNWQDRARSDLRILNYQGLLNRVGDKIEIAEEVIRNIKESLPQHLAQCRHALEHGNIHELRQVAHTVKGSAGTAGAEIVADRASQINKMIRKGILDTEILESFLEELEEAATDFLDHIQERY